MRNSYRGGWLDDTLSFRSPGESILLFVIFRILDASTLRRRLLLSDCAFLAPGVRFQRLPVESLSWVICAYVWKFTSRSRGTLLKAFLAKEWSAHGCACVVEYSVVGLINGQGETRRVARSAFSLSIAGRSARAILDDIINAFLRSIFSPPSQHVQGVDSYITTSAFERCTHSAF